MKSSSGVTELISESRRLIPGSSISVTPSGRMRRMGGITSMSSALRLIEPWLYGRNSPGGTDPSHPRLR